MAAASAHQAALGFSPRRRVLVLVVVALAFVMDLLDVTIINVAIPSIQAGLHASNAAIQWSVAGYTLAFAVLLIAGGRLGDVYGYRRLFLIGISGFMLASLGCGLAPSASVLVAARLLQGAAAALMVPQVMALMQLMYPPEKRFRVYAVFGVLGGTSAALGPVLGGLLIEADGFSLGWRLCFLINLPVGLFSLLAGWRWLPAGGGVQPMALDTAGTGLSMLWLGSLVLPLIEGPERHWPAWCVGLLLASLPLGWALWRHLLRRMARSGSALVDPALFKLPAVRLGLLCSLCLNGITPAYLLVMTFVLQMGLHYTPLQMAWLCLPIAAGAMLSISVLGRHLMAKLGTGTILLGAAVTMLSVIWMAWVLQAAAPPLAALLLGQAGFGLGLGLTGPPLSAITLQDVPLAEAGAASGLVSAAQQVSGALGVAAAGLVFFAVLPGLLLSPSASGVMAQARAYLRVLPLLLGLLALGALIVCRMPPLRQGAAVPVH